MEFKIGDRVKGNRGTGTVISIGTCDDIGVEHDEYMGGHNAECGIAKGKPGKNGYCWWYIRDNLTKLGGNNMKKEDLKVYDIVTLKNGDKLVLLGDEQFLDVKQEGHWIDSLDDYLDDLKCRDRIYSEYDIVKVERPVEYETVYKRDDVVELTVDEISEKLGYKVKVVGEDR